MKPIAAVLAALPLLSGCAILFRDPTHVDFRAAVGADDWPRVALIPLAVPVIDESPVPATPEEIDAWCQALGGEHASDRNRASASLAAAGEAALPALRAVRRGGDAEAAARANEIILRTLFGDVDALLSVMGQNFPPGDPWLSALEAPLDGRLELRNSALEILGALRQANQTGGLEDLEARQARGLALAIGALTGIRPVEQSSRRRAAGYDDLRHPAAMTALVKIVRFALRSPDGEIRRAAVRTAASIGGVWEATLFPDLIALGRDSNDPVGEEALQAVAAVARAGAEDVGPALVRDFSGPPAGPSNLAAALLPHAELLLAIAEDSRRSDVARAAALEAACYSGDARLSLRIQALCEVPGLKLRAFQAVVALGGAEAEAAILGALRTSFGEIGHDEAVSAAVRCRLRSAIPVLAKGHVEGALACAAIGALATAEDAGEVVYQVENRTQVEEVRPLFGALVRLSPLPEPWDSRARRAVQGHLSASIPDVRFLAACALSAMDVRAGIAAWGGRLGDEGNVTVRWPGFETGLPMWVYACGGLSQLTGKWSEGEEEDQRERWVEWWEEHRAEYGDGR